MRDEGNLLLESKCGAVFGIWNIELEYRIGI
jgi:hypothetical protein